VMFDSTGWRVDPDPSSRSRERVRARQRYVVAAALYALTIFSTALEAQSGIRDVARDSTFVMSTRDPLRHPSPFIGNGHFGLVVPPLGIGASPSIVAGLFENGAGDVPRIAASPAWNAIDVFDGTRWLSTVALSDSTLREYDQSIDMRTGVARTSYDWIDGAAPDCDPIERKADARMICRPIHERTISSRFPTPRIGCASRWRRRWHAGTGRLPQERRRR